MSVVRFFGDSFCNPCEATDAPDGIPDYWWGRKFANRLGKDIILHSKGGSSLEYTMLKLEDDYKRIQQDDVVVICYTTPHRFYLNGKNISTTDLADHIEGNSGAFEFIGNDNHTPEVIDAAKRFILHLYDKEKQERLWISHVLYIQQYLIPKIQSKGTKVIDFYSFPPPSYSMYCPLKALPVGETFILKKAEYLSIKPEPLLQTPNHFGDKTTDADLNEVWSNFLLDNS
jgi:hypothetical protein